MTNNEQNSKAVDLLMGVRTEQSLRDAVREHNESHPESTSLELCPFGSKDWIAGERIGQVVRFGDLAAIQKKVMARLTALRSFQRIRSESLRIYAIRPQVPVFRDAAEDAPIVVQEKPLPQTTDPDTLICPVCRSEVHRYNIQCDPNGKAVGCYLCRGDARSRR